MKEKKSRQLRKMVTKWWQNCDKKLTKKLFSQFVSQNEPIIEMISTEKINLEFTFEEFFNWAISYQGLWSRGCGELWQGIDKRTFASCSWRYLVSRKIKYSISHQKRPILKTPTVPTKEQLIQQNQNSQFFLSNLPLNK